jgi:hypothetical protein
LSTKSGICVTPLASVSTVTPAETPLSVVPAFGTKRHASATGLVATMSMPAAAKPATTSAVPALTPPEMLTRITVAFGAAASAGGIGFGAPLSWA